MRYVYLAGPISGVSWDEATSWREWVQDRLHPGIVGVSPMRLKEWYKEHDYTDPSKLSSYTWLASEDSRAYLVSGSPSAIAARDFEDVRRCDMVLAYLPLELNERRPSWGTAIELGLAWAQKKPVCIVTTDPSLQDHPLMQGAAGWIVPDLPLGVDVVNSVLGVYVEREGR